jgi:hypothetical protein
VPVFCSLIVPSRRSTSAVLSAIGAGPVLISATATATKMARKTRFRTTRRLASMKRQRARKNRRTGPGFDADMKPRSREKVL